MARSVSVFRCISFSRLFLLMLMACALLMVGLGVYALVTFSQLANRTSVILRENYDSVSYMDRALHALDQEDRLLLKTLATRVSNHGFDGQVALNYSKAFENALLAEENNITVPGEGEAVKNLKTSFQNFHSISGEILNHRNDLSSSARIEIYNERIAPAAERVRKGAEKIRKLNQDSMEIAALSQGEDAPRLVAGGIIGTILILLGSGLVLGRRLLRQAAELQTLRTHFLAIASHELRTPVTSLRMGLDVLRSNALGELNEEQSGVVSAGIEDCDRLLTLSRHLLDVTKIQSGQLELHQHETDLKAVVADAVASLQSIVREHRVTIELDIGRQENLLIQADPIKLGWVLTNILGNALRYAPAGSEINITAQKKKKEAWLSVSDRGSGIPPHLIRKVFTPYYQSHRGERGAVGLGLSISQEIIAAHGGRIWVESQPRLGEGTTMTFSIPLAEKG